MGAPAVAPRRAPARRTPARRAPARRAPARSAPPSRRKPRANGALASRGPRAGVSRQGIAQPALAGAALIPHAAVRTAGAVRDLSDSGLIVRLTAGRGWIAVLCALLGGIVALNVVSLSINSTSGRVSQAIEEYERQNSSLRGELAEQLSASRVELGAATLGLSVPPPEEVRYLEAGDADLERLASLLGGDHFLVTEPSAAPPPETSSYPEPPASAPIAPSSVPSAPTPTTPPVTATPPSSSGGAAGGGATGGIGL